MCGAEVEAVVRRNKRVSFKFIMQIFFLPGAYDDNVLPVNQKLQLYAGYVVNFISTLISNSVSKFEYY
jgi:hypothetical protein